MAIIGTEPKSIFFTKPIRFENNRPKSIFFTKPIRFENNRCIHYITRLVSNRLLEDIIIFLKVGLLRVFAGWSVKKKCKNIAKQLFSKSLYLINVAKFSVFIEHHLPFHIWA